MSETESGWKKPIIAEARLLPNFIFHVLACANVGFESDYADRYAGFLDSKQLSFLESNRKLLIFGSGEGSDLADLAIFIPIYLRLESKEGLAEYYDLICQPGSDGTFSAFFSRYQAELERLASTWAAFTAESLRKRQGRIPTLRQVGDLYLESYDDYKQEVWPKERAAIGEVAEWLNSRLLGRDLIAEWEKLLGLEFKADQYTILLCSAIGGGPNANSIGYEANVFYSDSPREWLRQFISHEVGTHLLIDLLFELAESERFGWKELYGAYESMVRYYNTKILAGETLVYDLRQFRGVEYEKTCRKIESRNPGIEPRELLVGAMADTGAT